MGEDDKCALEDPMGETLATKRRRGEGENRQPLLSTLPVRARLRILVDPLEPADEMEAMELASLLTSWSRAKAPSRATVAENMVRKRSRAAITWRV